MAITAIILAAGYGRRMNGNKLHRLVRGKEMIERVLETVAALPEVDALVVTNDRKIKEKAESLGIRAAENKDAIDGQSTSVISGVLSADSKSSGYLFFMGDQPFISQSTVMRIIDEGMNNPGCIIIPKSGDRTGSPVLFPSEFKDELLSLTGDTGGKSVYRKYPESLRFVEVVSELELLDADTPEDIEILERTGE
ncbi:nucleotidyltransferase family protein [Youngiibacter multivorans]|uniref:Molybdenum cofactor cytidylyltransferase n=1 Tax=Youngiibacter multivorans TaxID=937251 RepID=A0ABS4G3V0_9CLOT|nr:nucleotidyltransferase family protein [Youngiibacter multivorans]MBP1919228.1 molybdenum cofactor cytidylyltransferase [Youngiibacter multivorans]